MNKSMAYEIIDFHTHPYWDESENICIYKAGSGMNLTDAVRYLREMGISRICGSVIGGQGADPWRMIRRDNDRALYIRDMLGDFYIPGFHVHPAYVEASCREIERMHAAGLSLVGELVPRYYSWEDYSCAAFDEILCAAEQYGMVVMDVGSELGL